MNRGRTRLTIGLALAALSTTTTGAEAAATKVQKEIVKQAVELYPTEFVVPPEVSELAWDRATEWVSMIPDRRVSTASKNLLETFGGDPDREGHSSMDLVCSVRRKRMPEETRFTAFCRVENPFAAGEGKRSAAMLRRYILTADGDCMASGERWLDAAACLADCSSDGKTCELLPVEPEFPDITSDEPMLVGGCTLDQITTMAKAGLSEEQIKAACEG